MQPTPDNRPILVSVVSHGHGECVTTLLSDLAALGNAEWVRVILTLNRADETIRIPEALPYPLTITRNLHPRGFGANHNAAFRTGRQVSPPALFCVLNPDLRVPACTLARLAQQFSAHPGLALVAPRVLAPDGRLEDSARPLPTPASTFRRAAGRLVWDVFDPPERAVHWDWLAGMFMLLNADTFQKVGGFDESYFLYYEDVDLCCRIRLAGGTLCYFNEVAVVHDARRDSHRRLSYAMRHLASMMRFFLSSTYRRSRHLPRLRLETSRNA
jgi:hypothetical protein